MDWTEVAKGIIVADLWKAGIAFGVLAVCGIIYAVVSWMDR